MPRLIFVYNADSGFFSALTDSVHKLLSPATYECNLCRITYGAVGMRDEWRTFIENLAIPVDFLHRDEFRARHGLSDVELPAVFAQSDAGQPLDILMNAALLNTARSIDALQRLVSDHIAQLDQ